MIHNAIRGCTYKPARDTTAGPLGMWLVLDPRDRNRVLAWCESEAEARAFCEEVNALVDRVYERAIDVRLAYEGNGYHAAADGSSPMIEDSVVEPVADDFTPVPTPTVPARAMPSRTLQGAPTPPRPLPPGPPVPKALPAAEHTRPERRRLPGRIIEIDVDGKVRS